MNRTNRRNSIWMGALLGVMVAGQAMAATLRYQNGGDYFDTLAVAGNHGWLAGGGGPGGVPGALDTARFNWANNTVTLAAPAPTIAAFQMGVDESGGLMVNSGGILTVTNTSTIGNNAGGGGANPTTGFLTINSGGVVNVGGPQLKLGNTAPLAPGNVKGILTLNGGTLNVSGHLWVGAANNTVGTIDINSGGILNVGGMLGLGTVNATSASGGFGFLNVNDGGILNLANIHSTAQQSIWTGSLLDISGSGLVTLPGNFVSVVNGYITAGKITGNDIVGNVQAIFNSGLNKTLITVVPEPSTFALIAFAGLALAFRRSVRRD